MENDMSDENIKVEEVSTDEATPNKPKTPMIIVLVLLFAVIGFYLMNKNKNSNPTTTENVQQQSETAPVEGSIIVTGGNFKFDPNEIKVKKGEAVKITFKNSEGMHDFVLDEFNVKTEVIGEGKEETISFTPDKIGTYEYYCSVGSHRKMGMVGKLVVE